MTLLPLASVAVAVLIAQVSEIPDLAQWGVVGVVLVALGRFAQTTVAKLDARAQAAEAYARQLNEEMRRDIVPAATKLAEIAERMLHHLEDERRR